MKPNVLRRLEAAERHQEAKAPVKPTPIIVQQGFGGPFVCNSVTYATEEDALAAHADHEDVVLVSVVDGRRPQVTE